MSHSRPHVVDLTPAPARGLPVARSSRSRRSACRCARACRRCSSTSASAWPSARPALGIQFDSAELTQVLGYAALVLILAEGGLSTRWAGIRRSVAPAAVLVDGRGRRLGGSSSAVAARYVLRPGRGTSRCSSAPSVARPTPPPSSPCCAGCRSPAGSPGCSRPSPASTTPPSSSSSPPSPPQRRARRDAEPVVGRWCCTPRSSSAGGAAIGLAVGLARRPVHAPGRVRLVGPVLASASSPLTVLAYAAARRVHASGFLACYLAALVLGNMRLPHRPAVQGFADRARAGWPRSGCSSCSGCWPRPARLDEQLVPALVIGLVLLLVARPLSVLVSVPPFRMPWRDQAFLSWAGLRGAVPVVLATVPLTVGAPGRRLDLRPRLRARRRLHPRPGADPALGGPAAGHRRATTSRSTSPWRPPRWRSWAPSCSRSRWAGTRALHGVEVFELRLPRAPTSPSSCSNTYERGANGRATSIALDGIVKADHDRSRRHEDSNEKQEKPVCRRRGKTTAPG